MRLTEIYKDIENDLKRVEEVLEDSFGKTKKGSILEVNRFLLESPGKRLRSAFVLLSAKAATGGAPSLDNQQLINVACAIELIHMASLIHDDVIDRSSLRHHRPTINSKWGQDVSIALGDYLYSLAFELVSTCDNKNILDCISSATRAMCEGELIQVLERDNLSLSKERYIVIVKKKTASLFAASCQAGAMFSGSTGSVQDAFRQYGLNFGIAFQMIDDYLDIMSSREELGKPVGLDIEAGELTLPVLFFASKDKDSFRKVFLKAQKNKNELESLKRLLVSSGALLKTKKLISDYSAKAKKSLKSCRESQFKQGLIALVDFIQEKIR